MILAETWPSCLYLITWFVGLLLKITLKSLLADWKCLWSMFGIWFLTHGYSVGVFVSYRYHSISISAFFCVLIASSLLCAPGGNMLDQSRTSLEDFSREPVWLVYTLDLLFICSNLHCENCSAFIEKEFIPVAFLSYTCNFIIACRRFLRTSPFRGLLIL